MEKTDGVYPFVVGGSPTASPISRCAMATRVTESIISMTFKPLSRKYSAIALLLMPLLFSSMQVDQTLQPQQSTALILLDLRSFSMNSLTSRPRSPIKAITFISAVVFRAIIPSNVLFPTPLPAKIPTRCPFPTVRSYQSFLLLLQSVQKLVVF